jgi:uncharacterized protein (DUF433 family)
VEEILQEYPQLNEEMVREAKDMLRRRKVYL